MRFAWVIIFLACGCGSDSVAHKSSLTVFAAASLTDVLHELSRRFEEQQPGIMVHTHVGPTSLLARQIELGAPADLFIAASPDWTEYLREYELTLGPEMNVAQNTLVVLGTPNLSHVNDVSELHRVQRLAIADPSHVPAGVYGKQALQCAGVWDAVEESVIPVLDVRAALATVSSGAADVALVYGSDVALAPNLQFMFQIPDPCTPQITYVISGIRGTASPRAANAFIQFTVDSSQQDLWERFGFRTL